LYNSMDNPNDSCSAYVRKKTLKRTTGRGVKDKGRAFENEIRDSILKSFPQLSAQDVTCRAMGDLGVDILLSKAASGVLPLAIECKRTERLQLSGAMQQASYNCPGTQYAVVVHRKSREAALVTLAWDDLLELILCNYAEIMTWKERAQRAEAMVKQ